jgi:hypothetical protein
MPLYAARYHAVVAMASESIDNASRQGDWNRLRAPPRESASPWAFFTGPNRLGSFIRAQISRMRTTRELMPITVGLRHGTDLRRLAVLKALGEGCRARPQALHGDIPKAKQQNRKPHRIEYLGRTRKPQR